MVLFDVNKFKNTPKIKKHTPKMVFIEEGDVTFKIRITPESSVPTFVHNYRIKGYKVNTV